MHRHAEPEKETLMSLVRTALVVAIVAFLAGVGAGTAHAETDLGQYCFKLDPAIDTIRVGLTSLDGDATLVQVAFRWRNGAPGFQIIGTGVITESTLPGGAFEMALLGSHNNGDVFSGNKVCSIFAVLSFPGLSGPWQVTCTGAGGAVPPFTSSGTLNFIPCTAALDRP
jgi:hypothetical protein